MTDIIITFVPFIAAVAFFIRARGEEKARVQAERRAAELERTAARTDLYQREWLGKLAHELRSPIAAIVGYAELLGDGTFGKLDARGVDAIARIRNVADQLIHLAEGLERLSEPDFMDGDEPDTTSASDLIDVAVAAVRADADAREVTIHIEQPDALLHTRTLDARRALELALGAAIKGSPGHTLRVRAETGAAPAILIAETRLDPHRDDPAWIRENTPDGERPDLTGPALRLDMARRIVESSLHGRLVVTATPEGCTVRLDLPRLD